MGSLPTVVDAVEALYHELSQNDPRGWLGRVLQHVERCIPDATGGFAYACDMATTGAADDAAAADDVAPDALPLSGSFLSLLQARSARVAIASSGLCMGGMLVDGCRGRP